VLGVVLAGLLAGGGVLGGCAAVPARPAPAPRRRPSGAPSGGVGVIRPPAGVDPGIHAPALNPDPGTTPVIPPPGTPGGDPRVQPR
jgi:hypothetical protein